MWRWFLSSLGQKSIDITGGASENLVLFWDMTSVTWQVVLGIGDEGLG